MHKICDLHCDSASVSYDMNMSLQKNSICVDFNRLFNACYMLEFFAAFCDEKYYNNAFLRTYNLVDFINDEVKKSTNCLLIKNANDLGNINKKVGVIISIEGGEGIKSISDLEYFYKKGVRAIGLCWNNDNLLGGGCSGNNTGLTDLGRSLIIKMNELGIIADVSHLSEKSFYDVLNISTKPVIASHSNTYELCAHPRNLKKEQCKKIINNGGVIGINFYPPFLTNKETATINDIVNHILYLLDLGAQDNICLGSDFDGIKSTPKGISDCTDTYKIFDYLLKMGITDDIIQKIAYKNILRVLSICL